MRTFAATVIVIGCALWTAPVGAAPVDESPAAGPGHWLMVVGTRNTDPAQVAAFNHWYDDIDIPDVLKVPGYQRARRGQRQIIVGASATAPAADQDQYVALYDIETLSIDRTMVDMLMASRKMEASGRSTTLLKVVERSYFSRLGPSRDATRARSGGKNRYVYLERVACCRDAADENQLNDWYDRIHIPDVLTAPGIVRATRYRLYRVLMVEPRKVPQFLAVYEFEAESADQVRNAMAALNARLRESDRISELFVEAEPSVYLVIRDVSRN